MSFETSFINEPSRPAFPFKVSFLEMWATSAGQPAFSDEPHYQALWLRQEPCSPGVKSAKYPNSSPAFLPPPSSSIMPRLANLTRPLRNKAAAGGIGTRFGSTDHRPASSTQRIPWCAKRQGNCGTCGQPFAKISRKVPSQEQSAMSKHNDRNNLI